MYEAKMLRELETALKEWKEKYSNKFKEEKKPAAEFTYDFNIPLQRTYTPLDLADKSVDYLKDANLPGDFPYTRGINPIGYRGRIPEISIQTGYPTPEESNKVWKTFVDAGGKTGIIHITYDLPCQVGYDPGHPRAVGEVGRVGISMCSQRDWEIAFDGIDVAKLGGIAQVANALSVVGLANHIVFAENRGINIQKMRAWCQNDILKEFTVRGNFVFPVAPSLRLTTDTLAYCAPRMLNCELVQVCGLHYSEAQASVVHEAAFMLVSAFCYIQTAIDRGLDVDVVAPAMAFRCGVDHYGIFEQIARMRAVRRIYSRVLRDKFKAKKPESMMARMAGAQGGSGLCRGGYLNNIVRTTTAAIIGLLGGAQNISLRTYDEAYGIPTPEAIIFNTQVMHVLTQETGICDVVDPLGGSYLIESLASELEEKITKEIEKVDSQGGVIACIENGYMKRVVANDAYQWQKAIDEGKIVRLGDNIPVPGGEEKPMRIYRADFKVERQRIDAVKQMKRKRDNPKVKKALDEIKSVALLPPTLQNNLMPPVIEAVKCYATYGEIADILRDVWGEYKQPSL